MSEKLEHLSQILAEKLGDRILRSVSASGEITIVVAAKDYLSAAAALRDDPELHFEQLVHLTGIDYSDYAGETEEFRFAVSCHLLSIRNNCRLRLRVLQRTILFRCSVPCALCGRARTGLSVKRLTCSG